MQQELKDKIKFLVGNVEYLDMMKNAAGCEPFVQEIVEFMDEFARLLRKDKNAKRFSDVQTFAFWSRKASVLQMKERYGGGV